MDTKCVYLYQYKTVGTGMRLKKKLRLERKTTGKMFGYLANLS